MDYFINLSLVNAALVMLALALVSFVAGWYARSRLDITCDTSSDTSSEPTGFPDSSIYLEDVLEKHPELRSAKMSFDGAGGSDMASRVSWHRGGPGGPGGSGLAGANAAPDIGNPISPPAPLPPKEPPSLYSLEHVAGRARAKATA